jgi:hypothetical protein
MTYQNMTGYAIFSKLAVIQDENDFAQQTGSKKYHLAKSPATLTFSPARITHILSYQSLFSNEYSLTMKKEIKWAISAVSRKIFIVLGNLCNYRNGQSKERQCFEKSPKNG